VLTMAADLKLPDLSKLSVAERLELMDKIWESLSSNPDAISLPDWHVAEIARRAADFAADGYPGRPIEEVVADIKRRQ
jgi:putative addiction module component (TIGR02574 family)